MKPQISLPHSQQVIPVQAPNSIYYKIEFNIIPST